jgi:hypothetical protein
LAPSLPDPFHLLLAFCSPPFHFALDVALAHLDDGFFRALVEADSAFQTFLLIDERVTVDHGDRFVWTYIYTGLTATAPLDVHLIHLQASSLWVGSTVASSTVIDSVFIERHASA